jgi:hypothetical protein
MAPTQHAIAPPRSRRPLLWAALAGLATFLVGAAWSGPGGTHRAPEALSALVQGGSVALLWLAMAVGFGGVASDLLGLRRGARVGERFVLEAALGIALALALDTLLASLGLLGAGRGVVAWLLVAAGAAALLLRWRSGRMPALPGRRRIPLAAIALGPPVGLLLLAAASTPGWLWGSEFGGYDALAYHLELPKAWLVAGRLETLPTNAYSGLPSFVEAAFLHLFMLAGGPDVGAIAAQYLAVAATCLGAALCGASPDASSDAALRSSRRSSTSRRRGSSSSVRSPTTTASCRCSSRERSFSSSASGAQLASASREDSSSPRPAARS